MICCTLHKSVISLHCESTRGSWDAQPGCMIYYTQHKCAISHHCGWLCGSSDIQLEWMICCTVHIYVPFLHCEWANASTDGLDMWMTWHKWNKDVCWSFLNCQMTSSSAMSNLRKTVACRELIFVYIFCTFPFNRVDLEMTVHTAPHVSFKVWIPEN